MSCSTPGGDAHEHPASARRVSIRREAFDALIFDLDGVLTSTAKTHAAAWKRLFDAYLAARAARGEPPQRPFDLDADYRLYVDGKLRHEGVRSFLASRGIVLPDGSPDDPPGVETVWGLGNQKNAYFLQELRERGVEVFPSSGTLVRQATALGMRVAVATSSRNCDAVLAAAGLLDLFPVRVDGAAIARLGLRGKPAPDMFLEAARRVGVPPARAVVFEDAISGVQAGRAGGFGLVVGVDREGYGEALRSAGADVVVGDLAEVDLVP